ncbi:hypothetical protein ABAC460_07500 [Asticcacaulis sp. AC460]|nr:hypothetical protein ABAC460_07500 [Asticcacaulis sp. AC460]
MDDGDCYVTVSAWYYAESRAYDGNWFGKPDF